MKEDKEVKEEKEELKVLIVDDSVFIYQEMRLFLEATKYQVVGYARNGEKALAEYEKLQPDIVIMEMILPDLDGIQATYQILDRWCDARILLVNSFPDEEMQSEALKAGAKGVIFKSLEKESLIAKLDMICDMD